MHATEIVSVIFRLINFGAFICVGVYLFKKHVLAGIKLQITKRQQKLADLALQNQLLKEQAKSMDLAFAQQEAVYRELMHKIDLWKNMVAHRASERDQERIGRQQVLTERVHKQQAYIQLRDAQQRALLPAIERARELLEVHYAAMPLGNSYMADIVKHMEKNKS